MIANETRFGGVQCVEGHGENRVVHGCKEYKCPCGKWIGGKLPRGKDEFDVTVNESGQEFFVCQSCIDFIDSAVMAEACY